MSITLTPTPATGPSTVSLMQRWNADARWQPPKGHKRRQTNKSKEDQEGLVLQTLRPRAPTSATRLRGIFSNTWKTQVFLITASNNAQGRVHVHITSDRATVIVKAGGVANSKPERTSHPKVLKARMKLKLTKDGATGADKTIHQAISKFYLSQPQTRWPVHTQSIVGT